MTRVQITIRKIQIYASPTRFCTNTRTLTEILPIRPYHLLHTLLTFIMSATIAETVTARSSTPTLRVIKNGFGAEITGLDFADGVTDEGYRLIEDAVKKVSQLRSDQVADVLKPNTAWICRGPTDKFG